MTEQVHKLIILGSGPAGLTAAIYAARAQLEPLVLEGMQPGGQLTITTDVENFPGFPDAVTGPKLMDDMKQQAARFGTEFEVAQIDGADLAGEVKVLSAGGKTYRCHALVIATGATARWLGLESEALLKGHGVSACATCDGFFFKEKDVAVVGGGDSAMEEATFLTKFASKVYVIHRRDELRASKAMIEKAEKNAKIEFIWNTIVTEVMGTPEEGVTGLGLKDTVTGMDRTLPCQGLFLAIGHTPNTEPFREQLDVDSNGYIITEPGSTRTSIAGVFAAGDVQDHRYRQAVTAAGSGCMAALDAEAYLEETGKVE